MIVLDASLAIEILLATPLGRVGIDGIFDSGRPLCAPHLLDVEVTQVIRRYVRSGEIGAERGAAALRDLADLPLSRYPHDFLLPRIWAMRENITAYDATYVSLAQVLDAELWTCDRRMANAPGSTIDVRVVTGH